MRSLESNVPICQLDNDPNEEMRSLDTLFEDSKLHFDKLSASFRRTKTENRRKNIEERRKKKSKEH